MHTREQILRGAQRLFVTGGYNGTSIGDIASALGGSRASVYQYFESKDQIFLELLAQCEPAVLQHAQSLGRLGPDADGLTNLYRWLCNLAELYDAYAVVFFELPGIGLGQGLPPSRAMTVSDQYAAIVAAKIRAAGVQGLQPADATTAVLRIVHMVNAYRSRNMFKLAGVMTIERSLAIAMQRLLFPDTPAESFESLPEATPPAAATEPDLPPTANRTDLLEPSAVSPVRQDMLSSASALFARHGFYAVSMDDIASAAGVSRATLYRHFNTKVTILAELSTWAVLEGAQIAADLRRVPAEADTGRDALHVWLSRYLHFHRLYGSVIRAWFDGTIAAQLPEDIISQGLGTFHSAVSVFLDGVELPAGMDRLTAAAIFLAVLGRLSEYVISQLPTETDFDGAALMKLVIERALLDADRP